LSAQLFVSSRQQRVKRNCYNNFIFYIVIKEMIAYFFLFRRKKKVDIYLLKNENLIMENGFSFSKSIFRFF